MKIGDKVSFLSEKGGGIIAGFQGKNIVLVEDEDGFQIPTPITEVVVVAGGQDYETSRIVAQKQGNAPGGQKGASIRQLMKQGQDEEVDMTVADTVDLEKPITFTPPVEERQGGNQLTCFLAFVPVDIKEVTNTRFEVYFVNDSNYFVQYAYMTAEGSSWTLRSQAEVEPNTKFYMEEIGREDLNEMMHIAVQMLAYKKDKPFAQKPPIGVQLRLDPVKFYKLHTFQDNQFFDTPALLCTIVENDRQARPLFVDAKALKQEMYKQPEEEKKPVERHPENKDTSVVDLHIDQLLDSTAGMTHQDILQYQLKKFREVLEENKDKHGKKIVFIHGKGEGVLRHAIINELTYRYKRYQYQDASFQEYGYGATQVVIR
ncbi:DUF2027 domain-containing protein [Prevotella sp. KH2C16]|uniref:DUF2027 domain-containing protein n=1 Tax=Prevotella sp. KH2C16 TaxID=1855325 RepID=UPI0008F0F756|nr:DUF2027 domain-containing protein [Prevotella sp. KH2C16]SFF93600.1 Smr domain-containing protein [Prevotella sp. KH2C16]